LKDRALKNQEFDLYNQIDKLRPDHVDYLVRKHDDIEKEKDANQLKLNPIKEVDDYTDSDAHTHRSLGSYIENGEGGEFWEEIETKIKVPPGVHLP
jgi:hypothetical protein